MHIITQKLSKYLKNEEQKNKIEQDHRAETEELIKWENTYNYGGGKVDTAENYYSTIEFINMKIRRINKTLFGLNLELIKSNQEGKRFI